MLCSGNSLIINIPVLNVVRALANPTTHPNTLPTTHSSPLHQSTLRHRFPSGIKQKKGQLLEQKINRGCIRHGLASPCSSKTVTVGKHILFPLHYSLSLACQDQAYLHLTPASS